MGKPFQEVYSELYNTLYADKDYEGEVDLLEKVFGRYGGGKPETVLDLGCGTGNHAFPLARRGYRVTGVDRSTHMLHRAEARRAAEKGLRAPPRFSAGDICTIDLGETYDVCICMFAVLCYVTDNAQLELALKRARAHLSPGGLYIFDFWYGPQVVSERPEQRVKTIEKGDTLIMRTAEPTLDMLNHCCTTEYRLMVTQGNEILHRTVEAHTVRFFFPREIDYFLAKSGFELLRLGAFPDFDNDPVDGTWNVMAVAKAV